MMNYPTGNRSPLISVIIPAYNHAQFVCRAVDCVLAQDYQNFEIIVVDDGSTDNTQEVLQRYQSQIRLVTQHNRGLSAARNTGILHSRGDFFQFLDADDFFPPERFSKLINFYLQHQDYGAVYTAWEYVDETGNLRLGTGRPGFSGYVLNEFLHRSLSFPPGAVIIKRECIQKAGLFDVNLRAAEDINLWLRVSAAGYTFGYLDDILFSYRIVRGSLSRRLAHQYQNEKTQLENFFSTPGLSPEIVKTENEAYAILHCEFFTRFLNQGEIEVAKQHLVDALRLWPDLLEKQDWIRDWIAASALSPEVGNQEVFFDTLFNNLPEEAASIRALRNQIQGHCHTVQVFKLYADQQYAMVRPHLLPALFSNPGLFLNRGFLKIFLRSCITPSNPV